MAIFPNIVVGLVSVMFLAMSLLGLQPPSEQWGCDLNTQRGGALSAESVPNRWTRDPASRFKLAG